MSGAIHLQNRLDRADVVHIYELQKAGIPSIEIGSRYGISLASVCRILDAGKWSKAQQRVWGEPTDKPFSTFEPAEPEPEITLRNGPYEFAPTADNPSLQTLLRQRELLQQSLLENSQAIMQDLGL